MQTLILIFAVVGLAVIGYMSGRGRAILASGGSPKTLHSLPSYYGTYTAFWIAIPAIAVMVAWLMIEPKLIQAWVMGGLPDSLTGDLAADRLGLLLNDIRNLASGNIVSREIDPAFRPRRTAC